MTWCLAAAGVYNLAWGTLTVLRPAWLFDLTGLEQPNYPFIWQCVGMIVGKIFGPLGYLEGMWRGTVPREFGWTLPTNDLVWWIPFGLILMHAWRVHRNGAAPHA